jgi:hypothetical protein
MRSCKNSAKGQTSFGPATLRSFLLMILLCCPASPWNRSAFGQADTALVSGEVVDQKGAFIPSAQITLQESSTGVASTTASTSSGAFTLPPVKPGHYQLSISKEGFADTRITDIVLNVGDQKNLIVKLKVGQNSEIVSVNGDALNLNTTDGTVSTVVDRQFVENLPMNGRSFQSLLTAVPGVVSLPGGNELAINGQRPDENYFTVDGVSANVGASGSLAGNNSGTGGYSGSAANFNSLGTTQALLSIDAMEEFRAATSTYSAEYGRVPGGQFSLTTRSGTNNLHGSLYEYFRNEDLDANNWFNDYYGTVATQERQNDYGGTLGGPVMIPGLYHGKDKTFFFFSYEGLRLVTPQAAQTYAVPDLAFRQAVPDSLKFYINAFPLPNGSEMGNGFAALVGAFSTPSNQSAVSIRIDHSLSDRFKFFARYNGSPSNSAGYCTGCYTPLAILSLVSSRTDLGTAGLTSVIAPAVSNDLRFNLTDVSSSSNYRFSNYNGAVTPDLSISIPEYVAGHTYISPYMHWGLYAGWYDFPNSNNQLQLNIVDSTIVSVRSHRVTFGVDYRRISTWLSNPALEEYAAWNSEASVIANTADHSAQIRKSPYSSFGPLSNNLSFFIQDDWKAKPDLSLSFGLRWDIDPAPTDTEGREPYTATQITDLATTVVAPHGTPLWQTQYGKFAPRFGIAYQARRDPATGIVLRGGFGLFYDNANSIAAYGYNGIGVKNAVSILDSAFPYTASQVASVSGPSLATPYAYAVYAPDPHMHGPYTSEWNAALEQALGTKQSLTITYVGSGGKKLIRGTYYYPALLGNTAFASSGLLTTYSNGSISNYNALQVQFQRQLSRRLQLLSSYTWSHALDNTSSNAISLSYEYASSDNDVRDSFQLSGTYQIPGSHYRGYLSVLTENWDLNARVQARSALPVNVTGTSAFLSSGDEQYYYPNRNPGVPLYIYDHTLPGGRKINYQGFTIATDPSTGADIQGDAGRNIARSLGMVQADIAVHKEFVVRENLRLQFRAEAFNVLNHPMFGSVYSSLTNGEQYFGRFYTTLNEQVTTQMSSLYQSGGPRSLQLALRLRF